MASDWLAGGVPRRSGPGGDHAGSTADAARLQPADVDEGARPAAPPHPGFGRWHDPLRADQLRPLLAVARLLRPGHGRTGARARTAAGKCLVVDHPHPFLALCRPPRRAGRAHAEPLPVSRRSGLHAAGRAGAGRGRGRGPGQAAGRPRLGRPRLRGSQHQPPRPRCRRPHPSRHEPRRAGRPAHRPAALRPA